MSVGVNVLFKVAAEVASVLGDQYDVEIVETHHRLKKDAPSGTALRLADVLARSLGLDPRNDLIKSRDGDIGERPPRKIGVQTLRGGDVVGDHTVFFLGPGERVELTHRATSRGNFAQGALRAAQWIVNRPPGLYDMQDVLGVRERAGGTP
jgi:4-hydroxy-tetrahydrodipicolinate reductase